MLVGADGQPKVLDFGVARIVGEEFEPRTQQTLSGQLVGTLAYMSPEQVKGDPAQLDIRTDVYSLGVLAYELISGRRPHEVGSLPVHEAIDVIASGQPQRISELCRLPEDAATIVHKAIAKERDQRYDSAAALAADMRRFLDDEPIVARPPSRSYQLRMFARRNRSLVSAVGGVFVALLAGLIVSLVLFFEKEQQRAASDRRGHALALALQTANTNLERAHRAEEDARAKQAQAVFEAETAQGVTDYLVTLFEYASPERKDFGQVSALTILDAGVERIRDQFHDRPAVRGRLLNTFGRIYNWLQLYDRSRPILEEALELTAANHGEDSAQYADTLERLAFISVDAEDYGVAEPMQRRVMELRERHLGADHPLFTDALNNLAITLLSTERYDESLEFLARARELRVAELGAEHHRVAAVDYNLGLLFTYMGRHAEARACLERSHAGSSAHFGPLHWRPLMCSLALADCLRKVGDTKAAVERARSSHDGFQGLFGDDSPLTQRALRIYAVCLRDAGRSDKAVELLEGWFAQLREGAPKDVVYCMMLGSLASALREVDRSDESEKLYLEAIDQVRQLDGGGSETLSELSEGLASLYRDSGRNDEARAIETSQR